MNWPRIGVLLGLLGFWALVLWAFLGCAPMKFAKAGGTDLDLQHDGYDCQVQWDTSGPGQQYARDPLGSLGYLALARSDHQACLERKGWKRVDE